MKQLQTFALALMLIPAWAQKETVGLATGAKGVGPNAVPERYRNAPTLADAGIEKKLSISITGGCKGLKYRLASAYPDGHPERYKMCVEVASAPERPRESKQ